MTRLLRRELSDNPMALDKRHDLIPSTVKVEIAVVGVSRKEANLRFICGFE
jgi:hypothetical protein